MNRVLIAAFVIAISAAAAQAPRLLVLNKEEATLAIIDPGSGKVLGRVPTGAGPHEVVVSTDGKLAFASNYGTAQAPGNTISMIDLAAQKEIRRIDISPLSRPHGLWFSSGKLYFTAEADKKIARYDPAANNIDWLFETGQTTTHMVLVSSDGRLIATSNIGSGSVSLIQQDKDGSWIHTLVKVGQGPEGIDLTPDGREIWSAHSRDGGVSVIDVATRKVVQTIPIGTKRSNRIKITPDGKYALVSDLEAGELIVIDRAARKELKRLQIGKMVEGILIPDNTRAFVAVNGENYVAEIDLKTLQVTRKIPTGAGPDGLAWTR
ncbi:MAG TPA: YncE family protein [Vicinamibacterales bacterium]|nr:YncE family protein [Vicinamibacterales bacterium]